MGNNDNYAKMKFEVPPASPLSQERTATASLIAQLANQYASSGVFYDYMSRKSTSTIMAQKVDLKTFSFYLGYCLIHVDPQALQFDPESWSIVSWGLVSGFVRWMLDQGFSIGSINRKLSTVRTYARLACMSGFLDDSEYERMRLVRGYSFTEGKRIDQERSVTRRGHKKAEHVSLTTEDVVRLKEHDLSRPQGCRDAVMMCLFLDHGLRCGEVAIIKVDGLDMGNRLLDFFRPKVDMFQRIKLTEDTYLALKAYENHMLKDGCLLRCSVSKNTLTLQTMGVRSITKRVGVIGLRSGIKFLSAHDLRHSWARRAARGRTDAFALRDAGGWSSLSMPNRYVEAEAISNERVVLG